MDKNFQLDLEQLIKVAGGTEGDTWECPLCKQTIPKAELIAHTEACMREHPVNPLERDPGTPGLTRPQPFN